MKAALKWRAVLLDLDGTLLDTLPDLAESANRMRASLGLPTLATNLIGTFIGKGADHLIACSLAGGKDPAHVDPALFVRGRTVFFDTYRQINGDHAKIYDGVREGIEALLSMDCKLAVVTNKPTEFTLPLLERTGLAQFMSAIVCGDTCEQRKPDPQPIRFACTQLDVPTSAALTIGDSMNDALAARAAGCAVLAVPYGYSEGLPVTELPVDGIVSSILEAFDWMVKQSKA
jgi:phosphoglycolate phosphatase